MNLYRLVRLKQHLNHRNFSSISRLGSKSFLTNKNKIDSALGNNPKEGDEFLPQVRLDKSIHDYGITFSEKSHADEIIEKYIETCELRIPLDQHLYMILIECLTKEGRRIDFNIASQVCRRCIAKPWFREFFTDNPLLMNTLLRGVVWSSSDEFLKLVEAFENQGLRPVAFSYSLMIDRLCKYERSAEAMEYFEILSWTGVQFMSNTYKVLLEELGRVKNLPMIKRLYEVAREKNVQLHSDCCETLIAALIKNEDFDGVSSAWEYYYKDSPREELLDLCSDLLLDLCQEYQVHEAKKLLEWMVQEDMIPRKFVMQKLMGLYREFNHVDDVKHIFRCVLEKRLDDTDICCGWELDILHFIAKVGDSETAKEASEFLMTGKKSLDITNLSKDNKFFLGCS